MFFFILAGVKPPSMIVPSTLEPESIGLMPEIDDLARQRREWR